MITAEPARTPRIVPLGIAAIDTASDTMENADAATNEVIPSLFTISTSRNVYTYTMLDTKPAPSNPGVTTAPSTKGIDKRDPSDTTTNATCAIFVTTRNALLLIPSAFTNITTAAATAAIAAFISITNI